MKSIRYAHQSTVVGDQLFVVGGDDELKIGVADTETVLISKNVRGQTSNIPAMLNKRKYFGMCTFAGCIFVAGGVQKKDEDLEKCEVYSFESSSWTKTSSMNTKRNNFALIYFEDKIWAIGGYSNGTTIYLDTIENYSLAENKWTTTNTKLLSKRCGHRAVVHNKKFFVIGGCNDNGLLSSVEVYSSETNQFSVISPMSQARAYFGCSLFNNNLIVFGGQIGTTEITDSVELYDIDNQVWSKGSNLPLPLTEFGYANTN